MTRRIGISHIGGIDSDAFTQKVYDDLLKFEKEGLAPAFVEYTTTHPAPHINAYRAFIIAYSKDEPA